MVVIVVWPGAEQLNDGDFLRAWSCGDPVHTLTIAGLLAWEEKTGHVL
jgi:hypothetical protein